MVRTLPAEHIYMRLSVDARGDNIAAGELGIRKAIQDAIAQTFGASMSHTYIDILWIGLSATNATETVIRVDKRY